MAQWPENPRPNKELVDACRRGDVERVRACLQEGMSPNCRETRWGWSVLNRAVDKGYMDIVNVLLQYGAECSKNDIKWAKRRRWTGIAELLNRHLQEKEKHQPDRLSKIKETVPFPLVSPEPPFFQQGVIEKLSGRGVERSPETKEAGTTKTSSDSPKVEKSETLSMGGDMANRKLAVVEKEILTDIRAGMTNSELMNKNLISETALEAIFCQLVEAGALTQAELDIRKAVLRRGNLQPGPILQSKTSAEKVSRPNLPLSPDRTLIALLHGLPAATGQYSDIFDLISGAENLETRDLDGATPLILAAKKGYTEVVARLLLQGADYSAEDSKGRTAASWAQINGHERILELLADHHVQEKERAGQNQVNETKEKPEAPSSEGKAPEQPANFFDPGPFRGIQRQESVKTAVTKNRKNNYALTGLILGIVSVFLYTIGIIPILAIVFSAIGLSKAKLYYGKGKIQAAIGLCLGIIYTLLYMQASGHLGSVRTDVPHPPFTAGTLRNSRKSTQSSIAPTKWPDLSAGEVSVVSEVTAKAMDSPLTDSDLAKYVATVRNYCHRNAVPLAALASQGFIISRFFQIDFEYREQLARCILLSFDRKQPFISDELKRLVILERKIGITRDSKLRADLRMIPSTAYRTVWTDEFGVKCYPLSRDEILDGIRGLEVPKANLAKLSQAIQELATMRSP